MKQKGFFLTAKPGDGQRVHFTKCDTALFIPAALRIGMHALTFKKDPVKNAKLSAFFSEYMNEDTVFNSEAYLKVVAAKFNRVAPSLKLSIAKIMIEFELSYVSYVSDMLRLDLLFVDEFAAANEDLDAQLLANVMSRNPSYKPIAVAVRVDQIKYEPNQLFLVYLKAEDGTWFMFDESQNESKSGILDEDVMRQPINYIMFHKN